MVRNKLVILFFVLILVFNLFSAGFPLQVAKAEERPIGTGFYENFDDDYNQQRWSMAGVWTNGEMFNATWYPDQVTFSDGTMRLAIDKEDNKDTNPPYKAGEIRTNEFYHYGLYEVSMKPAKSEGTVSSFFTYTGPWDWDNDPWDEIDIEFLGKDTTRIQFNYFTNGVGGNEYYHDLGFDASESFNTYAFMWKEDSIQWFVNGEHVYTATENIPQTPQKIMKNLWPAVGVDDWTGVFDGNDTPVYAYYDWVRYTPLSEVSGQELEPSVSPAEEATETEVGGKNESSDKDDNRLPDTTTSLYTNLLIGLLILGTGIVVYFRWRKKVIE
ncbi:glycoside hydrolase family 16 protein [Bacillus tamaricis]|uniref:Beta-glucanase n=1 Tax=Evansella tamaricis TaxID=2069301 RepID=A0ABS6JNX2_9BACI|nr:glycoside hydrolase family 16 protein [Evansella tamaricis]MBU9714095.1 glycoside hydrolase family 16 protein [Evansella tamaricis]